MKRPLGKLRYHTLWLWWLVALLFWNLPVFSAEFYRLGFGFRQLGMGNTGVANANGSESLFFNPATLANIHIRQWNVLEAEVHLSNTVIDKYNKYSGGLELKTTQQKTGFLRDLAGKSYDVRLLGGTAILLNLSKEGATFGLAGANDLLNSVLVDNLQNPSTSVELNNNTIGIGGISWPLLRGQLIFGVSGKYIKRTYLATRYTYADALSNKDFPKLEDGLEDEAYGYDLGLLYRPPSQLRWRFAVSYQNIGGIEFKKEGIPPIEEEVSAGVSIAPVFGELRTELAVDYRDITEKISKDAGSERRMHYGIEIGYLPVQKTQTLFALRAGLAQGAFTYGAEITLRLIPFNLSFGYANYTAEKGVFAGQLPDLRQAAYLGFFLGL